MLCKICKKEKPIAGFLGLCRECIIEKFDESLAIIREAHKIAREAYRLPAFPPKAKNGLACNTCGNECKIPKNSFGYCGLVKNSNNKLIRLAGTPEKGLLEYYYDPLPTNCVASHFCPASSERGYNLAVFYGACNFNCLFCQNWFFKNLTKKLGPLVSASSLAEAAMRSDVNCVCFFGGTPDVQIMHAIKASELMIELKKPVLRICMESNGNANPALLKRFAELSMQSGGCIKIDLKFWDERLNIAITGISNKVSYKNFEMLAEFHKERREPYFLYASTLLVPHYVTLEEIKNIASFIASLDESIPYILLAFHPEYKFSDMGFTSKEFALKCLQVCKKAGLENVEIGNKHLLV